MRTGTLELAGLILLLATPTQTLAFTSTATDLHWFQSEIDFIARLQARLTGSPEQNILIDRIEAQLTHILGVHHVYEDIIEFSYNDPPVVRPSLSLNVNTPHNQHIDIQLSGAIPYSGTNSSSTVTGRLVNVITPNISATPNWAAAKDAIALANLTNVALDYNTLFGAWPATPLSAPWPPASGVPAINAVQYTNLVAAAAAGVRGVVYIWDNITAGLLDGQYVPFQQADLAIPGVYVQSPTAVAHLLAAANSSAEAVLTLPGKRIPNTRTRTLYAIVNGTDPTLSNETAIISTHTDGVNALEENGHIALLHYARHLKTHPPRRTTILLFVTGHMHYGQLVAAPARATDLWLRAHPELWNGTLGLRAVFGSCVEHLGAVHFAEDLVKGTYTPTNTVEPEWLFAATAPLAALVQSLWSGVEPNITRVLNPSTGKIAQSGEGLPLLRAGIPEVSLVTSPPWLIKIWDRGFDERTLIDTQALVRQVESLERVWTAVDALSVADLGTIRYTRMLGGDKSRAAVAGVSSRTLDQDKADQLKPSKCPLRMRSPMGDGARRGGGLLMVAERRGGGSRHESTAEGETTHYSLAALVVGIGKLGVDGLGKTLCDGGAGSTSMLEPGVFVGDWARKYDRIGDVAGLGMFILDMGDIGGGVVGELGDPVDSLDDDIDIERGRARSRPRPLVAMGMGCVVVLGLGLLLGRGLDMMYDGEQEDDSEERCGHGRVRLPRPFPPRSMSVAIAQAHWLAGASSSSPLRTLPDAEIQPYPAGT
ncbi:hypothetical protein C8F01DRAFT_1228022 [Mycena amicta]|nr:hypothetical protein C8F01DRAFT_1228022 [Mycena amicta]